MFQIFRILLLEQILHWKAPVAIYSLRPEVAETSVSNCRCAIITLKVKHEHTQYLRFHENSSSKAIKNRLNGEFNGIKRFAALKRWIGNVLMFLK
ncbi:unnamed protein product [Nesidiocoris tenuis]|uniref:Uncharacterized protein n=1 Tax=Nesidiocoris tenuis TaxID=355587 RepID=A0A6H5GLR9_9HEMI|nr:unnamed protein product [Nesidiocoris tenuis]